jgi:hypothetical protein
MSERLALEEFQGKVLETAYRLTAYSLYGGKRTNAIRALARRCPGWQKDEIGNWLDRGIAVQESARAWLKENNEAVHELYRNNKSVELISASFHKAHSDWPNQELVALLGINFLYFYLM